jgi:hypothetical protein
MYDVADIRRHRISAKLLNDANISNKKNLIDKKLK